jgi:hypothetical protein
VTPTTKPTSDDLFSWWRPESSPDATTNNYENHNLNRIIEITNNNDQFVWTAAPSSDDSQNTIEYNAYVSDEAAARASRVVVDDGQQPRWYIVHEAEG